MRHKVYVSNTYIQTQASYIDSIHYDKCMHTKTCDKIFFESPVKRDNVYY